MPLFKISTTFFYILMFLSIDFVIDVFKVFKCLLHKILHEFLDKSKCNSHKKRKNNEMDFWTDVY